MRVPLTVKNPTASDAAVLRLLQEYVRRRSQGDSRGQGDLPLPLLREKIARAHHPLVESVARRFLGAGEPLDDLIQEGCLGLLSALEYFDPSRGVRFSTYATHFIAGAIRHFLRDRSRMIREPAWLQEAVKRIERATEVLATTLERDPTPREIAQALSLPVETVEEILASRSLFQVLSYEEGSGEGDAEGGLERLVLSEEVSLASRIENQVVVQEFMERLKPFEQQVLYEHYFRNLNQTEIATKLGVSCNYVSVTLRKAVERLGKMLSEAEVQDRHQRREVSIIDSLSGLYTQAHLSGRLEEALSRAVRSAMPLSLIHFELQGLPVSGRARDEALSYFGLRLRSSVRRMDFAGRGPGESLIAVLTGTGPQVELAASRLLCVLEECARSTRGSLRVHAGTAWHPDQARTAQELLRLAREEAQQKCLRAKAA